MDSGTIFILFIIIFLIVVPIALIMKELNKYRTTSIDFNHVNQESFKRYAKFYDEVIPSDDTFEEKLNKIYEAIEKKKVWNLEEIAKMSNCTIEECVLKINYLKNKRVLGNYYIDTTNNKIFPCSKEDMKIIDKYKPYIYHSHLQIDEIANMMPNPKYLDIEAIREEVFNDIKYLNDKKLINGIKLDEIDRKIIYYTIEKRKENKGFESQNCPNCGAINDVAVNGKTRCGYCKTIIIGSKNI